MAKNFSRTRDSIPNLVRGAARMPLILAAIWIAGAPLVAETADQLLEAGQRLLAKGDYRKALRTFREADAAANGSSAEVAEMAATAAVAAESWELVQEYGEKALSLADSEARVARAHQFLGLAALRGSPSRPEAAKKHFELGLPDGGEGSWETIRALAESLEMLGELEGAARLVGKLSSYEEARETAPRIGHRISRQMGVLPYFGACLRGMDEEEASHPRVRGTLETGKVPTFGGGLTAPERTRFKPRAYVAEARRRGLTGEVVALVVITRSGRVVCPVAIGEVDEELAYVALPEFSSWEFLPAQEDGEPVPVPYLLTLAFHLGR